MRTREDGDGATLSAERRLAEQEARQLRSKPDMSQLTKCAALRRGVLETLRLTAHTLGGLRIACQPTELCCRGRRYLVERGETLALSHIAASLDQDVWGPDAALYRPRRKQWLTKHSPGADCCTSTVDPYRCRFPLYIYFGVFPLGLLNLIRAVPLLGTSDSKTDCLNHRFSVFSQGIHQCPGAHFALAITQCTVALLLVRYDIAIVNIPGVSFARATLAQRDGPVPVRVSCY